jgi:hypothetical protein
MAEPREVILGRFPENALERAIEAAMKDPARDRAQGRKPLWQALYASEVIVPQSTSGPDKEIPLPEGKGEVGLLTLELGGEPHAVIFSSVNQMHLGLPDGCTYARVQMPRPVRLWPEAPAALNPQGFGCTLTAKEVRGLPIGPMAARKPSADPAGAAAQAESDGALSMMFAKAANQLLLSDLGIHVFKDAQLILVGKLQTPLDAMLDYLRESSDMGEQGHDGMFAVVSSEHPVELVRVDLLAHGADPSAGALIRRSSAKTWPRPMLPVDYRLAA